MEFFSPAVAPFTTALAIMALIAALELAGLLFGVAFSGLVDGALPEMDADIDGGDAIGKLFAWLYVGKVPVLIVFAAFLAGFGLSGLAMQSVIAGVFGSPLPALVAAPLAFFAALPLTRLLAGAIALILPREETDAVSSDTFVGRIAEIVRGEARMGAPAEAKLADGHGQTHYILVEPDEGGVAFAAGAEILITEQHGAVFRGVLNANSALSRHHSGGTHA